jgi:MoaA/NifB/PqqE/SkfB family radical SAM enzyme
MQNSIINKDYFRQKCVDEKKFWLKISNCCNNKCIFCLDGDKQGLPLFNDYDFLVESIDEAYGKGFTKLILSGGEATIHPEFINLISYAKKTGFNKIQVITNGRMFSYPDFARTAVNQGLTETTFSIHSNIPDKHDFFTGIRGSFKQAVNGIINVLKTKNCIVNIDVVVNKLNYNHINDIIELFSQMNIFEYDLLYPVPFGHAYKNSSKLFFTYEESKSNLASAFDYTYKDDYYIWTNRFPPNYLEDYEDLIQDPKKLFDEIAGRKNLFINYYSEKHLNCMPKHCEHCFIKDICKKFLFYTKTLDNGFNSISSLSIKQINGITEEILGKTNDRVHIFIEYSDDNFKFYQKKLNLFKNRRITFWNTTKELLDCLNKIPFLTDNLSVEVENLTEEIFEIILKTSDFNSMIYLNKHNCHFIHLHADKLKNENYRISFKIPLYSSLEECKIQYFHLQNTLKLITSFKITDCAYCIHKSSYFENQDNINMELIDRNLRVDMDKLVDDYILNDYYVKSSRCSDCIKDESCRGMHINFIRIFGFKILKPVKN